MKIIRLMVTAALGFALVTVSGRAKEAEHRSATKVGSLQAAPMVSPLRRTVSSPLLPRSTAFAPAGAYRGGNLSLRPTPAPAVAFPPSLLLAPETVSLSAVSVATALNETTIYRPTPLEPIASIPDEEVYALPGQVTGALSGQIVPALPGQVVAALPGQLISALSGQIVAALPDRLCRHWMAKSCRRPAGGAMPRERRRASRVALHARVPAK